MQENKLAYARFLLLIGTIWPFLVWLIFRYTVPFSILPQPQKECGRMFFVPLGMGERGCVGRGNKEKEKKAWRPMVYSYEFNN